MKTISSNMSALFVSVIVCVVMLGTTLFFWKNFSIPSAYLEQSFLGAILFCITLLTVLIYQSRKIYDSAHSLARSMTRDMLEDSQELFPHLFRKSPLPYIVIDDSGVVTAMNIAVARLFSVELDVLVGINIFLFLVDDEGGKATLIPEYFKEEKSLNEVEVQIRRPDGVLRWVSLSLFSFRDRTRKKQGLLTLVDITKQKQVDKAKTEFVSLASHQLRTPISAMKWNVELLVSASEGTFTPLQKTYADKIARNIDRMDMLVADFLNVSKLELGTLEVQYTTLDLVAFIQGIVDEYIILAQKKNVQITIDWDTITKSILSDSNLLHMIISNVIGNAVKYTPSGGVVRVHVQYDGAHIMFVISDTGIGIPEEEQGMIFSKLFRGTNAQTEIIEGTGLGLYIVQEAVHILGGTITFISHEGRGSVFTVTLPIK